MVKSLAKTLSILSGSAVAAGALMLACSSSNNTGGANGGSSSSAAGSGASAGGDSAGSSGSSAGSDDAGSGGSSPGMDSGGSSGSSAGSDSGGGGSSGGSNRGPGCLQTFAVSGATNPPALAACEEFLSPSDYAGAKSTCDGLGVMGMITYSWVTSCPTGMIGGCKVPAGTPNGAPGGDIRWKYSGNVACAAGETRVNADGTP